MSATFTPSACPQCGGRIRATCELVPGICGLETNDDGTFDYDGDGVRLRWDGQRIEDDGHGNVMVECVGGHVFAAKMEGDL